MITRWLRCTDSSATMASYSRLVYLFAAVGLAPLLHVLWAFALWGEIPTWVTWVGALLTIISGSYILYRERQERPLPAADSIP